MNLGPKLDRLDFKILAHVQRNGRITNVELSDAVGLSPSPCLARGGYDYLLKFMARDVAHHQEVIEGILERDFGIEKYFSFIVIKSPIIKRYDPIETLFEGRLA